MSGVRIEQRRAGSPCCASTRRAATRSTSRWCATLAEAARRARARRRRARRAAGLGAPEAVLPRPRPRDPRRATTGPRWSASCCSFAEMVWALYGLPQAGGGGGRRRARGRRRLHPGPHRRPPRPAPRRRADRPQRGEGRRAAAVVGVACCCARRFRPRRSGAGRAPRPQLRRRRGARASGLADELADADGLRGPLPARASRSSWRRTPTRSPPPRPGCAPAS